MHAAPDYLNPNLPTNLRTVRMPVVVATNEALCGFGFLVDDPKSVKIEIVRWPSTGRRPVDPDSGDEGGTAEGSFICEWKGDVLYGRNEAVGGHYLLGYAVDPSEAERTAPTALTARMLWHANYHPDGGQTIFPDWSPDPLSCRWHNRVTTSRPTILFAFVSMVRRDSTFIRMSGTKVFFR